MAHKIGKNTVLPDSPVSIVSGAAIGGKKEAEGPLGADFDLCFTDPRFEEKSFEQAEIKMQRAALDTVLKKSGLSTDELDAVLGGDLLNQCAPSAYAVRNRKIPYIGLYGACSTFAEGLGLSALLTESYGEHMACSASSHFCTAERQYRFPLEYGGQRPPTAQWTATACGCALVSRGGENAFIKAVSFGTAVDLGITDANNMGAAMAPAAAQTLCGFFRDSYTDCTDYDLILTGDLGFVGEKLMRELCKREGFPLGKNYTDCGLLLFDREKQQVEAGASGCGCSAAVFCGHILPKIKSGELNKVLLLSTGALLSPTFVQQGETVPGIAHLVCVANDRKGIF